MNSEVLLNDAYKCEYKAVGFAAGGAPPVDDAYEVTESALFATPLQGPSVSGAAAAGAAAAGGPGPPDGGAGSVTPGDTGTCQVLVLSLQLLRERLGQHWLLNRKLNLFTAQPLLLSAFMRQVPFLEELTDAELHALCARGVVMHRPANYVLMSEGMQGDAFFVLLHGSVGISVKGITTAVQGPGKHFGETSLVKGIPVTATVRSQSPCLVLVYHRAEFLRFLEEAPAARTSVDAFIAHCTVVNLKAMKLPLFQRVSDTRMDVLARSAVFRVLAPGEVLYSKGDVDDNGFILSQVGWVGGWVGVPSLCACRHRLLLAAHVARPPLPPPPGHS